MHTPSLSSLRPRPLRRPVLLGLGLLLSASLPAGISSRPFKLPEASAEPEAGIPYFLPKPVLLVHTSPELDAAGKVKGIKVDLKQQIVADRTQGFLLLAHNGPFTAATTSFEVSEGLLSAVNDTRESKLPEALQSIASFIFSLQTIPALKAQVAAFDPAASTMIPLSADALTDFSEKWKSPDFRDETVQQFRKSIAESIAYSAEVKAFVAAVSDELLRGLIARAWDDLAKNGQPLTFEQIMDGVDPETLKQGAASQDSLHGPVDPLRLGNRLSLEIALDFGESCIPISQFQPQETVLAGPPYPGGAVHRPANTATRPVPSPAYQDRIIIRGERAVIIKTTLKPDPANVAELLVAALEKQLAPRATLVTEGLSGQPAWQEIQAKLEAKATEAAGTAAAASAAYLAQLESLLQQESTLSDGRGQFSVALLPVYATQKTAMITKLETAAKTKAAALGLLGDNFAQFQEEFLTLLIKIHTAERIELRLPPDWTFASQTTLATFPAPEAYQIPLERLALGKVTSGLQLSRGLLRSVSHTRPAPAAEIAAVPAKVVAPYVAMLKELLTIRVSTLEQSDDVLAQKIAITKLEKDLETLTKEPVEDPAATAHAQSVAELTRTKEILELQKKILELQQAAP